MFYVIIHLQKNKKGMKMENFEVYLLDLCGKSLEKTFNNEEEAISFCNEKENEALKGCFAIMFEIKKVIC